VDLLDERDFLRTKLALRLNDLPQKRRISDVFHRNTVHVFRIDAS
jgi:hypothetical protein